MEERNIEDADNSQNFHNTDGVDEALVTAQEIVDNVKKLTAEEEAYALPPMAAADVEMNKKTLVLDMDDTLIHTIAHPDQRFDFAIEFENEGKSNKFYVLKRPGVENLLQELSELYEIVVFTAGEEPYANAVLDKLDTQGRIKHRLTRQNCIKLKHRGFAKDLSSLGRDLEKLIFVDDRPFQCFQSQNAYPIAPFVDDVSDRELFVLVDFCKRVAGSTSDVREEIRQVAYAMSASRTGKLPHVEIGGKKTLVLALEGVLVYSTSDCLPYYDFTVDVYFLFWKRPRYILKRPGVDTLIAELAELFEIVVFSSDDEDYGNAVLDMIDPSQTAFPRTHRLFKRDYMSCKDLSKLGRELSKVIFVDVAPVDCFQTPNMYSVFEFKGDMRDKTLFKLIHFCKGVAHSTSDLRAEIYFNYRPPSLLGLSGWVEYTSETLGRKYYYNPVTRKSTWIKPLELMSEEEYYASWRERTSKDGHKYFYKKLTRDT